MIIRVFEKKEDLYKEAANFFIDSIKNNPNIILGLATGGTAVGLYENLIIDYKQNKTDYSNVKSFNLDEYIGLPKSHAETYYNFMRRNLFDHINISLNNTHLPNGLIDEKKAVDEYNELLSNNKIDMQLLGIGSNGHIAFNEPGTSFDSITHVVTLKETTRIDNARFFNSLDEVPKKAITMGIKNIMDAKTILLIATGKNKADAVYQMIKGEVDENVPASVLQNHDDCYIFLDKEAASKLDLK